MAMCLIGLAGMLLLAPILAEPDGVPSPAASLGAVAPWQQVLDARSGNPTLVDVSSQIQPWLLHLRRELRRGRLPYWNPYQFSGAPFWANGQSAPLFPLHLLFAALPLQLGLILLPWLRVVIGGYGAWLLARELGVGPRAALISGFSFPLSGMLSSFLLFPMANALCLVPWVFVETERCAQGRGRICRLGLVVGLQALSGHPETVVHTLLLAALYLGLRSSGEARSKWLSWLGGVASGVLIGAVQLLPLAYNVVESSRWGEWLPGERLSLATMSDLPLRLVLPDLFGNPAQGTWWGPFNYNATASFVGLVTLFLGAVGLRQKWSDRRWRALLVLLVASALAAYQVPPIRELLLALPGLQQMLHHRLLFAVALGLGLFAAAGAEALSAGRRGGLVGGGTVVVLALGMAWARHFADWDAAGLIRRQGWWTLWAVLAGLVLAALSSRRIGRDWVIRVSLCAVLLELAIAHHATNPALDVEALYPRTPAISFLEGEGRSSRIAAIGASLRPNAAMVYELYDVRGDDTLKPSRYEAVYRSFASDSPYFFRPITSWGSAWLDRLGVRWVLAEPDVAAPEPGWSVSYDGPDARIFERHGADPLVRWQSGGAAGIEVVRRDPGNWELSIDRGRGGGRIIVAETWDEGWSARADGRGVEVEPIDGVLLGIPVSEETERVTLIYRPPGIIAGSLLSLLGAGSILLAWLRGLRERRAREAA